MHEDSTVSCYDDHARAYDAYQSAVVPGYEEMLDLVAAACCRYLRKNPSIIDLGCGTGNASLAVLEMVPAARIFLVDGSENMISVAKEKIAEVAPQSIIGCKVADLSQAGWSDSLLCEEYDAVVSTLVLEHLPFDRYRSAIDQCFALLRPGGWMLAAEGYQEEGSDMLPWFNELMESRRQRLDPQISDNVSRLRNELEVHYYCSKEQKAAWWRESGFERVNVLWQYLCVALMAGKKPG